MTNRVGNIFISHSHLDNKFGHQLLNFLRTHLGEKILIFFDNEELQGGDEWMRIIMKELERAENFIVIITKSSINSPWVRQETDYALSRSIQHPRYRVIPVIGEEGVTDADINSFSLLLTSRQFIDLTSPERWKELLHVLESSEPNTVTGSVSKDQQEARRFAEEAHKAYGAKKWGSVIEAVRIAIKWPNNAQDITLWEELADAHQHFGQYDKAIEAIDEATKISPSRVDLWNKKASYIIQAIETAPGGVVDGVLVQKAIDAWGYARGALLDEKSKIDLLFRQYTALLKFRRHPYMAISFPLANDLQFPELVDTTCNQALELSPKDLIWRGRKDILHAGVNDVMAIAQYLMQASPPDRELWKYLEVQAGIAQDLVRRESARKFYLYQSQQRLHQLEQTHESARNRALNPAVIIGTIGGIITLFIMIFTSRDTQSDVIAAVFLSLIASIVLTIIAYYIIYAIYSGNFTNNK